MSETIHVALGARAYDVHVGAGLLARAAEIIAPFAPSGRIFIVTDKNVAHHHGAMLTKALSALKPTLIALEPGEHTKSFAGLEQLTSQLLAANISRKDLIVAFGGGVIGDLAGLAAGLVKRGVEFVQIPTTLLAQVDSSVGGKTAIDTPHGKNLIGLFHQPRAVIVDTSVLATLPERERRAGYAEIVKVGLIGDAPFFEWCEKAAPFVIGTTPEPEKLGGRVHRDATIATAVKHAIAFKARVVEKDETEQGARALLNLGHTFAHALEAHGGYSNQLLHGEAVAVGMGLAFQLSANLGLCGETDAARVRKHLSNAGFVTDLRQLPGAPFDPAKLLALMAGDKKNEAGKLTLILARGIGRAFIEKDAPTEVVRELLQQETT
jgi:3-dehydroquinate synthase